MSEIRVGPAAAPARATDDARLRRTAREMEGMFVQQLFKAMRESVPEGGLLDGGTGEEMFSGMLDQHLAIQVPGQWESGLAASIYRHLRGTPETAAPEAESTKLRGNP